MHRDRLAESDESKLGARRHVGSLLDVNEATLRNWIENRCSEGAKPAGGRGTDSDEVRALKKRVAELDRANEILRAELDQGVEAHVVLLHRRLGWSVDAPWLPCAVAESRRTK